MDSTVSSISSKLDYIQQQINQTGELQSSHLNYLAFSEVVEFSDSLLSDLKTGDLLFNNTIQIVNKIGEGAQASVYRGYIKSSDKFVAVKHYDLYDSNEERIALIENEFELMKSIIHTNIIHCFNFEKIQKEYCQFNLVMEYVEMNLFNYLEAYQEENKIKQLPLSIVKRITRNILQGLGFLHKKAIIHRDLKPENILLSRDLSEIKIADFGVATCIRNVQTLVQRTRTGTMWYMSPEVISGKPYAYDADIWSLGCIVYQMVSGMKPYECKDQSKCTLNSISALLPVSSPLEMADDDVLDIFYDKSNRVLLDFVQKCWRGNNLYRPTVEELLDHPFLSSS